MTAPDALVTRRLLPRTAVRLLAARLAPGTIGCLASGSVRYRWSVTPKLFDPRRLAGLTPSTSAARGEGVLTGASA